MDYIEYILLFGLGFYLGFKVADALMRYTFKKMVEEAGLDINDMKKFTEHHAPELGRLIDDATGESTLDIVEIKVEKHGEQLYVFRKDTDQFLGQGANKEDLIRRLGEKLVNVRLSISEEDGAEFIGGTYNYDIGTKEIQKKDLS